MLEDTSTAGTAAVKLTELLKIFADLYMLCVGDCRHRFFVDFVTNMMSIAFKSAGINP